MIKRFLSIDSKIKYCFHWILIYLFVIIIGTIITLTATYLNNRHFTNIAAYDYQQYITTATFNPNVAVNGAFNIIIDSSCNIIASSPDVTGNTYNEKQLSRIAEKLSAPNTNEHYSLHIGMVSSHKITTVVAYPMEDNQTFIFYREPPFVIKALIILYIMIGILVFFGGLFMYITMHMSQKIQEMQRQYIDNISHELKSPISSVLALTETMYYGLVPDEEKRKSYYKIIMNEMCGLGDTVSNMLELSKIQNGQVDCLKSRFFITDVFRDVLEKYTALCEEKGIDFTSQIDNINPSIVINTNQPLISRVLDILLNNAIKFAAENDGCVGVYLEETHDKIIITVSDNGAGIALTDQDKIFYRFYKGDKSHNESGSGLGLAIATEITEILSERLWLKSSSTKGSFFAFTVHKQ